MAKANLGHPATKKQCLESFKDLGPAVWKLIDKANNLPSIVWNSATRSYMAPSRTGFLRQIAKVLEMYDIERIEAKTAAYHLWYVNTGDSYKTTVMLYGERFYIGSWGDVLENSPDSCFH